MSKQNIYDNIQVLLRQAQGTRSDIEKLNKMLDMLYGQN